MEIPAEKLSDLEAKLEPKSEDIQKKEEPIAGKRLPKPSLDDLDIDPTLVEHYRRAVVEYNEEGEVVWCVPVEEWKSMTRVPNPVSATNQNDDHGPRNLGDYMTEMVNGDGNWHVFNVLPNGYGSVTVVLVRKYKMVIPTPRPIDRTIAPLELPTADETKAIEGNVADWAKTQGDLIESISTEGAVEGA